MQDESGTASLDELDPVATGIQLLDVGWLGVMMALKFIWKSLDRFFGNPQIDIQVP